MKKIKAITDKEKYRPPEIVTYKEDAIINEISPAHACCASPCWDRDRHPIFRHWWREHHE